MDLPEFLTGGAKTVYITSVYGILYILFRRLNNQFNRQGLNEKNDTAYHEMPHFKRWQQVLRSRYCYH